MAMNGGIILNRREEFRRRHASYLAQMQEVLVSVGDIMDRATKTDFWNDIQLTNPMIKENDKLIQTADFLSFCRNSPAVSFIHMSFGLGKAGAFVFQKEIETGETMSSDKILACSGGGLFMGCSRLSQIVTDCHRLSQAVL